MRLSTFLLSVIVSAIGLPGAAAAQSASVQGDWVTEGGWATVRVAPCPGETSRLCGRISALKQPNDSRGRPKRDTANADPKLRDRTVVGMPFLTGFKPAGANRWMGGRIYNPGDGKTYASRLVLQPSGALQVNGCVLVICKAQIWTRAGS